MVHGYYYHYLRQFLIVRWKHSIYYESIYYDIRKIIEYLIVYFQIYFILDFVVITFTTLTYCIRTIYTYFVVFLWVELTFSWSCFSVILVGINKFVHYLEHALLLCKRTVCGSLKVLLPCLQALNDGM